MSVVASLGLAYLEKKHKLSWSPVSLPSARSLCPEAAFSPLYPSKPVSFFSRNSKHFPSSEQKKNKRVRASAETIFVANFFFGLQRCEKNWRDNRRSGAWPQYNQTYKSIYGFLAH